MPAALPAATLVLGSAAGAQSVAAPIALAALLAALGVALGRVPGRALTGVGLGLLSVWLSPLGPGDPAPAPGGSRPVVLAGRLAGHWTRGAFGWTARFHVERYRQGARVASWRRAVSVTCYGAAEPPEGVSLRLKGFLTRAPGFANLGPPRPGPWRLRVKSPHFIDVRAPTLADLPSTLSTRVRRFILARLERRGGSPGAAFGRALVLGDRRALDPATVRGLRAAGLAHLLAVSGLHVGLVAATAWLAAAPLRGALRHLPALALVGGYLLLVGPYPAVLRASAMAVLAGFGLVLGRPALGLNSLALVGAVMILRHPENLRSIGFLLTASATAGILVSDRLFACRWTALPESLRRPLAASVGAQLFTLPWAVPAFRLLHPSAAALNLVAVPWTGLALLASFAWMLAETLAPLAAGPPLRALELAAGPFGALGELRPGPWLTLPIALSNLEALFLGVGVGVALARPRRATAVIAAGALVAGVAMQPGAGDRPEMVMLDVGQGEALLLRDRRRAILVDGGGWRHGDLGGRVLLPALTGLGVRRLDAVVLTHPDLDHCGGLLDIASYLTVREIWTAPGWGRRRCAVDLLTRPGIAWKPLWAGAREEIGRWRLSVVHPPAGDRRQGNDRSLVVVAESLGLSVLLTGDLEARGERQVVGSGITGARGGVLKLGHHGSKTSTSPELLAALKPRLAMVSAGLGNPYGHPSGPVLDRLARAGVRVLRTDRDGMIRLTVMPVGSLRVELPATPR